MSWGFAVTAVLGFCFGGVGLRVWVFKPSRLQGLHVITKSIVALQSQICSICHNYNTVICFVSCSNIQINSYHFRI